MNAVCCYEPGWAVLEDGVTPFRVMRARLLGGRSLVYKYTKGWMDLHGAVILLSHLG